jgi:Pyruvate/2-oxoacid:ferredoxin oxidoreductase delta subunit
MEDSGSEAPLDRRSASLRLANLCILNQINCWNAYRALSIRLSSPDSLVEKALLACMQCWKACSELADLTLHESLNQNHAESCAGLCENCAQACQRLKQERLAEVIESCTETAQACRRLVIGGG